MRRGRWHFWQASRNARYTSGMSMLSRRIRPLLIAWCSLAVLLGCALPLLAGDNWPGWRGPLGNGQSREAGAPLVWSRERSLAFRAEIPGEGASSPIVWNDAVFVTSQEGDSLLLLRVSAADGAVVWQREVARANTPRTAPPGKQAFHQEHNLASPTPVTDGELVIASFGDGTLAAYDLAGNQVWRRNLQDDFGSMTFRDGYASSPLLFEDLVISSVLQQDLSGVGPNIAPAYLVAHDKKTGHLKWKSDRPPAVLNAAAEIYGTPALRRNGAGEAELVVMGAGMVDAYNPADGKRLWSLDDEKHGATIASPTIHGNLMVGVRPADSTFLLELPGAYALEEQKLKSTQIRWTNPTSPANVCTPAVWGDLMFTLTDDGTVNCYDGASGRVHWRKKLPGEYRASPVAADSRIYFLNTAGLCTVIAASARFDRLAENDLDDFTQASPAFSNGRIYIRGKNALYGVKRN